MAPARRRSSKHPPAKKPQASDTLDDKRDPDVVYAAPAPSTPPTAEQITVEIAELERLKPLIPPTTAFGDNNIDVISAEITALAENLTHDQIYDRFRDGGNKERELRLTSAAEDAQFWRIHGGDAPSVNWAPLAGVSVKPISR